MTDEDVLDEGLAALRRLGVDGEIYLEAGRRSKVTVAGGAVESVEERRDLGLAVRSFAGGGVGFAHTTELTARALAETVAYARDLARHIAPDAGWRLPEPEPPDPLPFPNEDPHPGAVDMPQRIALALHVEKGALAADPRVRTTRQASYVESAGEVRLAHTGGLSSRYRYSRAVAQVEVVAGEGGASQTGFHAAFGLGASDLDPEEVGRTAAARAVFKLGARPAPTCRVPVVLERDVVAALLHALAPAFSARQVLQGTSLFGGRLGDTVASAEVSLRDDPRLPGGFGSAPADGEGVPTRATVLVERGRLAGYLHNTYSSFKLGLGRPGNAVRSSYQAPPRIGTRNLLLLPGDAPLEALLDRAGNGMLVTEVMGLHTVNTVTGDFSLGASGRRIERGRLCDPVDRMAISGHLLELLGAVEAVGSDLRLAPGGGGAPSVLLRSLSVAGR